MKYVQAKSTFIVGCIGTIEGHRKLVTMKAAGPKNAPSRYGTKYPSSCLKLLPCATLSQIVSSPSRAGQGTKRRRLVRRRSQRTTDIEQSLRTYRVHCMELGTSMYCVAWLKK